MSTESKGFQNILVVISVVLLVIALVALLNSLFNVAGKASNDDGVAEHVAAAADERIKPIADVTAGDVNAAPVARSAKQIVTVTCSACHGTGAMGAPKIGNKAQWNGRLSAGIKTLLKHAINGKGMMPARGGDATLSDDDIEKAIKYMLKESGL